MRVVTAGIGLRAGHVLSIMKEVMPEVEIVGYFDPQPTHLEMIGTDTPRYPSVEAMLSDARPDLFFVGSPNAFHLDQIRVGLESGVRVFAEKPVVATEEESFELAELLARHGTDRVMVGLVLRYSQHMVDLRSVLDRLGPIASLEANEHLGPSHGAFFMRDWRRRTALSGGFLLEKCCHDIDIYNMITASRPAKVASFGGRRSFLPEFAPEHQGADDIFHVKSSVWESTDDPFRSDGDIVDFQTVIASYESGASMAFHTNLNTPDEHRRFCVMGALGMAEGDFHRGYLRVTARDGTRIADHDFTQGEQARRGHHYGADHMMIGHIASYLRGETGSLPVGVVDALEAGLAVFAIDRARREGQVVDLTPSWARLDAFGLRG